VSDVSRYTKVLIPGTDYVQAAWTGAAIDGHVERGDLVKGNSLEDIARLIDVPAENLVGTIERYNAQVANGEDADYLKDPDGVRRVSTPPDYAAPIRLSLVGLTAVGMRIDHDACVIHDTSRAIPGLLAAGECVGGVLGPVYIGSGNSVANCSTFGRIAGRNAAAFALSRTGDAEVVRRSVTA
jgi:fumarate reductase flavoprotein subunit